MKISVWNHHGSQVLPEILLVHGFLFTGFSFLQVYPPAAAWDPLWDVVGTICFTMVFSVGCREISAPELGAFTPLPCSLTLGVCRIVFLTFFSLSHSCSTAFFLTFPKYVMTEATPTSLMGSALAYSGSVLELLGTCVKHGSSPSSLLIEVTLLPNLAK